NLARFFETLQREAGRNPSGLEKFLSDHPAPADRTQRIEKEAALIKYQGGGRDLGGFSEVRSLLASMPKAPSAANTAQKQPPPGTTKRRPGPAARRPASKSHRPHRTCGPTAKPAAFTRSPIPTTGANTPATTHLARLSCPNAGR